MAVVKTMELKEKEKTAATNNNEQGSKQGDGAFLEAVGFLWAELDLKD